jgi:hypothetical protein
MDTMAEAASIESLPPRKRARTEENQGSENTLGNPIVTTEGYHDVTRKSRAVLQRDPCDRDGNLLREVLDPFTGECPVAPTQKMIICPYPFCNARVWPRLPC